VFIGQTGSGKTTLAEALLRLRPYVVAHDVKGTLRWPRYQVYTSVDALLDAVDADPQAIPRVIYRPRPEELRDEGAHATLVEWVLARGHTTLYLDELYAWQFRGSDPLPALWAAITRGRELGVEVWASTQRPYRIPMAMLSEAEHYYIFRLRDDASRLRVEELTGLNADALRRLPKWDFYYVGDGDPVGPLRLALDNSSQSMIA
jgi:hypothetical protein